MTKPSTAELDFAGYLKRLLEDTDRGEARAAMARMRRGLGKPLGMVHEMDRYVLPTLPENASLRQEEACYLVAAMFAYWHQGKDEVAASPPPPQNLGKSLRALVEQQADRTNVEKSIEKRLNALLNAHRDDLSAHMRRIIGLLKAKDVAVNWPQLLHDINGWEWDSRTVQHEWAKGFWI